LGEQAIRSGLTPLLGFSRISLKSAKASRQTMWRAASPAWRSWPLKKKLWRLGSFGSKRNLVRLAGLP